MLLKFMGKTVNEKYIDQVVDVLKNDGMVIIPTDTIYALACSIRSNKAIEKVCRFKNIKLEKANFSFLCHDLSNISEFTKPFNTEIFRLMKNTLPGPYTYILNANSNIPAIFKSNKKTIGIRVPDNDIAQAIISKLGHPLMATSLRDADEVYDYVTDPDVIEERFGNKVDYVVDGGSSTYEPSTVIDCTGNEPVLIREGKGKYN
ncbi:MAG: threonylcarbamoyl-AMP synthase [Bacteroidetes bacterium]|nr:threonylcarbamoyl-AMP synthase [Bacteroidota bacterium]